MLLISKKIILSCLYYIINYVIFINIYVSTFHDELNNNKRRIKRRFRKVENNYFIHNICTIFIQYTFYNHDNYLSQNAQYRDSFFVVKCFINVFSICNCILLYFHIRGTRSYSQSSKIFSCK